MNTIPDYAILTDYGFTFNRKGSIFKYYRTNCSNCGKEIFKERRGYVISSNAFCSKKCQSIFRHDRIDMKGSRILDNINHSDFCYLVGLIATDGHICYPPNYVHYGCQIQLNLNDSDILDLIYNRFGGRLITFSNMKRWSINNILFVEYLKSIGMTHNKSFTINLTNWFNNLSDINKNHFMRGVIDGDGSIIKNRRGYWRLCIVSASLEFITMCAKHLNVTFRKDRNTYAIQISKRKHIKQTLENIYISEFAIKRKYNMYMILKGEE